MEAVTSNFSPFFQRFHPSFQLFLGIIPIYWEIFPHHFVNLSSSLTHLSGTLRASSQGFEAPFPYILSVFPCNKRGAPVLYDSCSPCFYFVNEIKSCSSGAAACAVVDEDHPGGICSPKLLQSIIILIICYQNDTFDWNPYS